MILLNWIKIILEINKYLQNQFYFKVWTYISSVLVLIVNLYVYLYLPVKVFFVLLSPLDDVLKVRGQNEGHSLPLYVQLGLEVTQKMAKVNVEKLREKKKDYKNSYDKTQGFFFTTVKICLLFWCRDPYNLLYK